MSTTTPRRSAFQVGDALVVCREISVVVDGEVGCVLKRQDIVRVCEAAHLGPTVKVITDVGKVVLDVFRNNKPQLQHVDELQLTFCRTGFFSTFDAGQHKIDFPSGLVSTKSTKRLLGLLPKRIPVNFVDQLSCEDIQCHAVYVTVYRTTFVHGHGVIESGSVVYVTDLPAYDTAKIQVRYEPSAGTSGFLDFEGEGPEGEIALYTFDEMLLKSPDKRLSDALKLQKMCRDYELGNVYECIVEIKLREKMELSSNIITTFPQGTKVRLVEIALDWRRAKIMHGTNSVEGWMSLTTMLTGGFLLGKVDRKYDVCDRRDYFNAAFDGDLCKIRAIVCSGDFLGRGPSVDAIDVRGKTALHYAVQRNQYDVVEFLLSACPTQRCGKFCNVQDDAGKTALHYASAALLDGGNRQAAMAALLRRRGADPTLLDWKQRSAMSDALRRATMTSSTRSSHDPLQALNSLERLTSQVSAEDGFQIEVQNVMEDDTYPSAEEALEAHVTSLLKGKPSLARAAALGKAIVQLEESPKINEELLCAAHDTYNSDKKINQAASEISAALRHWDIDVADQLLQICQESEDDVVAKARAWMQHVQPFRKYIDTLNKLVHNQDREFLEYLQFVKKKENVCKKASAHLNERLLHLFTESSQVKSGDAALELLRKLWDPSNQKWYHQDLVIFCLTKCNDYNVDHSLVDEASYFIDKLRAKRDLSIILEDIEQAIKTVNFELEAEPLPISDLQQQEHTIGTQYAKLTGLLELAKMADAPSEVIASVMEAQDEVGRHLLSGKPKMQVFARIHRALEDSPLQAGKERIIVVEHNDPPREFVVDRVFGHDNEVVSTEVLRLAEMPMFGVNSLVVVHGIEGGSGKSTILAKIAKSLLDRLFLAVKNDGGYEHKITATAIEIHQNRLICLLGEEEKEVLLEETRFGQKRFVGATLRQVKQMKEFHNLLSDARKAYTKRKRHSQLLITISVRRVGRDRTNICGKLSILDLSMPSTSTNQGEIDDARLCASHYKCAIEAKRKGISYLSDHKLSHVIEDFFSGQSFSTTILTLAGSPGKLNHDKETLRLAHTLRRDAGRSFSA